MKTHNKTNLVGTQIKRYAIWKSCFNSNLPSHAKKVSEAFMTPYYENFAKDSILSLVLNQNFAMLTNGGLHFRI